MITCAKCGKVNQPTRKFCIRCGSSLLMKTEAPKQMAPAPAPETRTAVGHPLAQKSHTTNGPAPPEKPSVSTGDKWVRPSSVERDRLRTGQRHTEKTELEKAREAFAVADKSDVESRMMRASEVKELMAKVSAAPELPASAPPRVPQSAEPPVTPSAKTVRQTEQTTIPIGSRPGGAKVGDSGPSMAQRPLSGVSPAVGPAIRRSESSGSEAEPPGLSKPSVRNAPEVVPRVSPTVGPAAAPIQRPPMRPAQIETPISRSKYPDDSRIREIESDLAHFGQQLHQLETEMETTRSTLDDEVERYRALAEAKKTRAENLDDDLRRAKDEWSGADKEYRKAKSRRDKEVDDAEKRIEDQKKRIKNAEAAREKRIREIEKEKQVS